MKKIVLQLKEYLSSLPRGVFFLSVTFITLAIFCNYYFNLAGRINSWPEPLQYTAWYFIFLLSFSFVYLLYFQKKIHVFPGSRFFILLLVAPAIFSWKMVYDIELSFTVAPFHNNYWNAVIYWPFKLIVITVLLWFIWNWDRKREPFYGLTIKNFNPSPYLWMLLIMVPLVAAASTQPDFLAVYPKYQHLALLRKEDTGFYRLLFELSYGSDFFTIELFFRGFLVLAFTRWFGRDAILPMALFYCTIHFGKPLGECISSFFGGMVLGVVTFHTRTIFGGLLVHLGIAWMMEAGGYMGKMWSQ